MFLAENLKYFRSKRKLSLRQAANALRVEDGTLKAWESGARQPEIALLPGIARLYRVSMDELFASQPCCVENYAQKLCAVYDSTRDMAAFVLADQAFRQLRSREELTPEDIRLWAGMSRTMMESCMEQAISLYESIPAPKAGEDGAVYALAHRQHMLFLVKNGKTSPELEQYMQDLAENCEDPQDWMALISALHEAGKQDESLSWLAKARQRFPENAEICAWGGMLCQSLGDWEQAYFCWEAALALEPAMTDALYACAECREKLGDIRAAAVIWESLAQSLEYADQEDSYPARQARRCREALR